MSNPSPYKDPRDQFAAERTFLAWIRTGLSLMGFGFVVARFGLFLREMTALQTEAPVQTPAMSLWVGVSLVLLGVIVNVVSAYQHWKTTGRIQRGEPIHFPQISMGIIVSGVLAVLGVSLACYLVLSQRA